MATTLTEHEIWNHLRETLRSAISHCGQLAILPAMGATYRAMITELQDIEGSARMFGFYRRDARWNAFSLEMAAFHRRIGDAIRAHHARTIFKTMQGMMQGALDYAEKVQSAKTERRGPILPKLKAAAHRDTRPVYVRPSGLLVPNSVH